jgi:preprotein translocase subunit YajC
MERTEIVIYLLIFAIMIFLMIRYRKTGRGY